MNTESIWTDNDLSYTLCHLATLTAAFTAPFDPAPIGVVSSLIKTQQQIRAWQEARRANACTTNQSLQEEEALIMKKDVLSELKDSKHSNHT